MKVMVVDDSKFMRKLISKIVSKAGHNVVCEAKDGEEALRKLIECKPDLVILDINMPVMSGLSVLEEAQKLNVNSEFIVLTAMDQPWVIDEAMKLGVKYFIPKPLKPQELLKVLSRVGK